MNRGPRERGKGSRPSTSGVRSRRFGSSDDASAEHRRKLEALFDKNGNTAAAPRSSSARPSDNNGRAFASPRRSAGRTPSEYRLRLERLRIARNEEEIREAADAFLAHHQLPDDIDVLYKVMQHPCEKVVREALGQISALLMQGRVSPNMLLEDRLDSVARRAVEPATRSFVDGVRAQIAQLRERAP